MPKTFFDSPLAAYMLGVALGTFLGFTLAKSGKPCNCHKTVTNTKVAIGLVDEPTFYGGLVYAGH